MREKLLYGTGAAASALLIYNLYTIFLALPDEAAQGAVTASSSSRARSL